MSQITIDTEKLWGIIKVPVLLIVIILLAIGGLVIYNQGQADARAQDQALAAVQAASVPTPAPTPTPSPYPTEMTITVSQVSSPPNNMFPEIVSTGGAIFDLSQATGLDVNGIIIGGTYTIYVTGSYNANWNSAEKIYQAQWISLVSYPSYYYGNYYNGWENPPGVVYSSVAYVDGNYAYTFQNDGWWHPSTNFDVTRGHQIVHGTPPKNQIRY